MDLLRRQSRELLPVSVPVTFERFTQRRILANALHRASLPIDVVGRRAPAMSRHPFDQIVVGRKIVATGYNFAEPPARACCKQSQKIISIAIHITEKGEIKRVRA